jgi:ankyrin repeat protein
LNYRDFKDKKKVSTGALNDMMTTPLHIAAEVSNIEAVRTLI